MNVALPFPTCERVVGVVGDSLYVAHATGKWQLFRRGRGLARPVFEGMVEGGIVEAAAAVRKRASSLSLNDLKALDHDLKDD